MVNLDRGYALNTIDIKTISKISFQGGLWFLPIERRNSSKRKDISEHVDLIRFGTNSLRNEFLKFKKDTARSCEASSHRLAFDLEATNLASSFVVAGLHDSCHGF